MGLLPTKGLTLPLMSFGGSSMLVTLGWIGLLMRINHEASVAVSWPCLAGNWRMIAGARLVARTVLIMAGGTGGHVFPALAAARVLRERGFEPVWLGTQRGLEAKLVPPQQIPIEWISVGGVRGKGIATLLAAPFNIARAVWQSLQVMRRRNPAVVLGAGGFVSGPGGIAAWLTRRPLVIHEQNAVAG